MESSRFYQFREILAYQAHNVIYHVRSILEGLESGKREIS